MTLTSSRKRGARVAAVGAALFAVTVGTAAAERVLGTQGGDTIRGTPNADRLYGRGGDDRVFGLAGDDLLSGGPGADRLWGGPGRDRLVARDRTQDIVVCGPGRDVAVVDRLDLVHTCETVQLPPAVQEPPLEPAPVVLENHRGDTIEDVDAVWYRARSGARVFASGSHQFVWWLEDVPAVARMRHGPSTAGFRHSSA